MSATTKVRSSRSAGATLTTADCEALLRRVCFGHLAFLRDAHVHVLPIRYVFQEGWVYFRADVMLREVIGHNPWLVLSVTELRDTTHFTSVIIRGGCHPTERTGSTKGDAAALRGIVELRDRAAVGRERAPRVQRTSTVFRLHVDDMQGITTFVPCPAGERPYDALEVQHLRVTARDHTASEDARADDDGMAEPPQATPQRSDRSSRTR